MLGPKKRKASGMPEAFLLLFFSDFDFQSLCGAGPDIIDKLFCSARRAPAFGDRPAFGEYGELLFGDSDPGIVRKLPYDGEVFFFCPSRKNRRSGRSGRRGRAVLPLYRARAHCCRGRRNFLLRICLRLEVATIITLRLFSFMLPSSPALSAVTFSSFSSSEGRR